MTANDVANADTDVAGTTPRPWYALSVFGGLALLGAAIMVNGFRLGLGDPSDPGAGMWPATIGCIWLVSALGAAAESVRRGRKLEALDGLSRPLIGLGLAIGFVFLFSYVGFVTSVVVVLLAWLRLLSTLSWLRIAVVTTVVTAMFYLLFAVIVGSAFPATILGTGGYTP